MRQKITACVYTSFQWCVRMLWGSSCIFLSVLPSSLLSLSLTPAPIHSCDISANETLASSLGTCFHLWWGYRERKGREGEVEGRGRGGREEAFGASDSTITPSSGTISTWLLWACLQSKERWITCTLVNTGFCILLDGVLYCHRSLAEGRLSSIQIHFFHPSSWEGPQPWNAIPRVFLIQSLMF